MHFNILSFFLSLGVFQGLFMAFLLLVMKSGNSRANRMLALLLADLSMLLLSIIFLETGYDNVDLIRLTLTPLLFLMGPALLLYMRRYENPASPLSVMKMLHAVPAGLVIIYYLPKYFIIGWMPFQNYRFMTFFFWHSFLVHFLVYLFLSIMMIRPARRGGGQPGPDDPAESWTSFLFRFFIVAFVMMVSVTVYDMCRIFIGFSGPRLTESLLALFGTVLICSVSFKGLMHPAIFFGRGRNHGERGTARVMPGEKAEGIMNRVADLMEKESPYLNPDLSLPELAAMTGIPRGDLSTAINASGGGELL